MDFTAAGAMGTIFTLSTLSTSSIEEVAAAAPNTIKWFQLYIYNDRLNTFITFTPIYSFIIKGLISISLTSSCLKLTVN